MEKVEYCPLHETTQKLVEKHETTLFGSDRDGGLVTSVQIMSDQLATIIKALYATIGLICLSVIGALVKIVMIG
jgi:hypothetical protein